jgi:hypothetical protein
MLWTHEVAQLVAILEADCTVAVLRRDPQPAIVAYLDAALGAQGGMAGFRRVLDVASPDYPALLPALPGRDEFAAAGLDTTHGTTCFAATGCPACSGTGFRGRTVIAEILVPGEDVRRLVLEKAGASAIQAAAVAQGMETLRRNGLRKVLEGETTIEEVSRVAQQEE